MWKSKWSFLRSLKGCEDLVTYVPSSSFLGLCSELSNFCTFLANLTLLMWVLLRVTEKCDIRQDEIETTFQNIFQ